MNGSELYHSETESLVQTARTDYLQANPSGLGVNTSTLSGEQSHTFAATAITNKSSNHYSVTLVHAVALSIFALVAKNFLSGLQ